MTLERKEWMSEQMSQDQLLQSKPLVAGEIEIPRDFALRCTAFLQDKGCIVTFLRSGVYRVHFPPDTRELIYAGQSWLYTRRTTIRFPCGFEIQKVVSFPLNKAQRKRTTLSFPSDLWKNHGEASYGT